MKANVDVVTRDIHKRSELHDASLNNIQTTTQLSESKLSTEINELRKSVQIITQQMTSSYSRRSSSRQSSHLQPKQLDTKQICAGTRRDSRRRHIHAGLPVNGEGQEQEK